MSRSGSNEPKGSIKNDSVDRARVAFQTPKLQKQNTATSELTMSAMNSANPSAFNSHASLSLDDNNSVKSNKSHETKEDEGPSMGMPGWVPPSSNGDIERLTSLLYHYEIMNFNQQQDIEHYKGTYDSLAKTIGEQEREKLKTAKRLKTLESTMKYDKIAADGIKRKYNLLELEVKELRYARDTLTTDLNHYKEENVELMDMLNEDRSNRLKLMHENDKLKKHNAYLINMQSETEQSNIKTNNILLERLHQLESLVAINKIQSATIAGQSEEMLVLTEEVEILKSEALDVSSQVIAHNENNDTLKNIIRLLQDEVSRLRKELMLAAMDSTSRSISTSNTSRSSKNTNIYTAIVKDIPPGGHTRLYEPVDYDLRDTSAHLSMDGSIRERRLLREGKLSSSDVEKHHPLTVGESQYSEQTGSPSKLHSRSLTSAATSSTYYCNDSKTVFDDQKPAAVIDRENYARAMKSRNGKRSGVVTPLASVKRPPNLDRDSGMLDDFGALSLTGESVVDEHSEVHSQMLELIQKSGLKPSKNRGRPKTVSGDVSNANELALSKETVNNLKKAYSMTPNSKLLPKNTKASTSAVSLLTTSSSEVNHFNSSGNMLPTLPSIGGNTVSFSFNNTAVSNSVEGSLLGSSESGSTSRDGKRLKKTKVSTASTAPRTLYVSSGLNMKHNEELNEQLNSFGAGSTKDILKKILGDREFL